MENYSTVELQVTRSALKRCRSKRWGAGLVRGFSMVEVMIIVAIVAILAAIAIPSYQQLLANTRITSGVNLILASIDTVRSEAVGRNRIAMLCRSIDPFAATPACSTAVSGNATADDWGIGWLVYSKPITTNTPSAFNSNTDTLIQRVVPLGSSSAGTRTTINWNLTGDRLYAVSPQGTRLIPGGIEPTMTIDYRVPGAALNQPQAKCIAVNVLGRGTVSSPTGPTC